MLEAGEVDSTAYICNGLSALAKSCLAIKTSTPSATSGVYTIDPDGAGAVASMSVYCDMTTDGGGWTLTAKIKTTSGAGTDTGFNVWVGGTGTTLPTTTAAPAGNYEVPSAATRAALGAGATAWRAQTLNAALATRFDVKSSWVPTGDIGGSGLYCIATGLSCPWTTTQGCSSSTTHASVLTNAFGSGPAAGATGALCDIGWPTCTYCVDASAVSTSTTDYSSTAGTAYYVSDFTGSPVTGDTVVGEWTLYWVR